MESGLRGRNALISGGGSGIGRAIALALAAEGVNIAVASNRGEDEALREIESQGVRALHLRVDVSAESDVKAMVEGAIEELGAIDLYVNNAAVARHEPVTRLTTAAWRTTIDTNLSACLWACREICKQMIARGSGSILIIGSTAQFNQAYGEAAYHISKSGLRVFKNALALEMAPHGIRVNLLVPGHFVTPLTAGISAGKEAILRGQIPLRRFGSTQELAATAVLLLSDRLSPYTTGAEFVVDGGLHLRPLPMAADEQLIEMNLEE